MSVGSSTVQLRVRHWRKSTRILHQHYKKLFTNATKCVAKARILALAIQIEEFSPTANKSTYYSNPALWPGKNTQSTKAVRAQCMP